MGRPATVELNNNTVGPEFEHRSIFGRKFDPASQYNPAVIAIDPGETTGWSLIEVSEPVLSRRKLLHENIIHYSHGQVDCGRSQGALDIHADISGDPGLNPDGEARGVARLMQLIDQNPNAAVLIEDFILDYTKAKKDRSSLSPVRVTARLEQELWHRNRLAHRQTPSLAKTTMTDEVLKELGLYQRSGGLNHARDADRHGLTFMRRAQIDAELRWRAWPWLFGEPESVRKAKNKSARTKPVGERIQFPAR